MRLTGCFSLAIVVSLLASAMGAEKDDWRVWRGPNANGVAVDGQTPPVSWSETKNVIWKAPVPGRGHSSPTLVGNKIILTAADERAIVQSVICYDRANGKRLWKKDISRGGFPRTHPKNTHATPTVASNGEHLFVVFCHHDKVQLTAMDLDGNQLWQKDAGRFAPTRYRYGYAPSPVLYKSTVIVAAESEADGFIAAFDQKTSKEQWRTGRPKQLNFSSPVVANVAGKDQLLISGSGLISSYDPATGKELWSRKGICTVTCGTMVWDDKLVFASGGYPQRGTIAVAADGSKRVAWTNRVKCYEQSMLVHDGYVYAIDDGGVAYCWKADDGTQMWTRRLGGNISASPVFAGGNIYITNERGTTFVFKANPKKFEPVAANQLRTDGFATPAIAGNRIYLRVGARSSGGRQEYLYCIGTK